VLQAYNKSEFHHIFPKAYLEELKVEPAAINSLANFCFLSRVDNNKIRKKAPSEYRKMMPLKPELDAILTSALVKPGDFDTDFETFRNARARRLAVCARRLAGLSEPEAE